MLIRTIVMALLWMILGILSMWGACTPKPQPAPKRLIPKLIHVITNQGSDAPSLASEPTSGSVVTSPHPEVSCAHFDLQHQYVELQVENERLKAENDLLRTEISVLKQPKAAAPVVYYQPATCSGPNCGNSNVRRGILGWRR